MKRAVQPEEFPSHLLWHGLQGVTTLWFQLLEGASAPGRPPAPSACLKYSKITQALSHCSICSFSYFGNIRMLSCLLLSTPELSGQSSWELPLLSKAAAHHTFGLQLQQVLRIRTERFHLLQYNGFRLPLAHGWQGASTT